MLKRGVLDLSVINSNVSNFGIPLTGKLLIKAKSQQSEDQLDYYFLEIDGLKKE